MNGKGGTSRSPIPPSLIQVIQDGPDQSEKVACPHFSGSVEHAVQVYFMAWVPWVIAPPARSAAATRTASAISGSDASTSRALFAWSSMQYGHWVVNATARASSSLYFLGSFPQPRLPCRRPQTRSSPRAHSPLDSSSCSDSLCRASKKTPDPFVTDLRDDLFLHEFILSLIWPAINDLLGVRLPGGLGVNQKVNSIR
jgi:hypothetical protein